MALSLALFDLNRLHITCTYEWKVIIKYILAETVLPATLSVYDVDETLFRTKMNEYTLTFNNYYVYMYHVLYL